MRSATRFIAIAALLTASATALQAQETGTFSLELRGGAGLPTKDLGTADLNTGVNLEFTANVQVMPHLALYAGWDWANFALKQDIGDYADVEDTGYAFGARFFAPSLGPVTPWLRAGGVYDHIELEGDDDDVDILSADHTLGWEAGAGAAIALGSSWSLTPGVRYRTFSPELDELDGEVDMSYLTIDIGISKTFGGRSMAAVRH
jgi:hypothetical protein